MSLSTLAVRRLAFAKSKTKKWIKNQTARKARRTWQQAQQVLPRKTRGWAD